jgi:hypothetical protein
MGNFIESGLAQPVYQPYPVLVQGQLQPPLFEHLDAGKVTKSYVAFC